MEENTKHSPSAPVGNSVDNATVNNDQCTARMGEIKPADVVPAITEAQCQHIKDNHGIDGDKDENCDDLNGELLCDIRQDLEYVLQMGVGQIFANDDSKCKEDDPSPTLASMWSRIYRFAQAVTCILCAYDPFINTLLKSGRFPQVLMGAQTEDDGEMDGCCKKVGYPIWVTPDELPTADSNRPVTAAGINQAIKDAILSVWHLWEEEPEFTYFAQTVNGEEDPYSLEKQMEKWPATEGDTALIASSDQCDGGTAEYEYRHDNDPSGETEVKWRFNKCIEKNGEENLTNFAVTHILKGQYEDKGVYFFDETWQVMDADLGALGEKIEDLEKIISNTVLSEEGQSPFVIATRPTLAEAEEVLCAEDKETLVLITG